MTFIVMLATGVTDPGGAETNWSPAVLTVEGFGDATDAFSHLIVDQPASGTPDATTVPLSAACSAPGLSAQANMLRPAVSELSGLASPNSLDVAA